MFCGNCGANNPDGSKVCGNCGAPLEAAEQPVSSLESIKQKLPKGNSKVVGLVAICVGAAVVLGLVAWLAWTLLTGGQGTPKAAVTKYLKNSMKKNGGSAVVSVYGPKKLVDNYLEDSTDYDSKKEWIKDINDALEDRVSDYKDYYGKNYKTKVEVRKVTKWKNSEIKDYNEMLEDRDLGYKIKDGATVSVKVEVKGKDDKNTFKPDVNVVKVGGKWYITGSKSNPQHSVIWFGL